VEVSTAFLVIFPNSMMESARRDDKRRVSDERAASEAENVVSEPNSLMVITAPFSSDPKLKSLSHSAARYGNAGIAGCY
jgi:hypothetical protein